MRTLLKTLVVLVLIAVVGGAGLWLAGQPDVLDEPGLTESAGQLQPPPFPEVEPSPFAAPDEDNKAPAIPLPPKPSGGGDGATDDSSSSMLDTPVDVTTLGRAPIQSEDELQALLARLRSDPALLSQLIDELRQETDPERLKLLAQIVGEVGGEQVALVASELIFSGDETSRALGLDLLQKIQPGNPEAREIVSGMLTTEVEPAVLVDTLTTLAVPGDVDDQSRAYLADQVAWLSDHQDASVRSVSLDILSRWTRDDQYTHVLLGGLDDQSDIVRRSAAYALAEHEDKNPQVIDRLILSATDHSETERVRRAALLALSRMPLTDQQRQSIKQTERELNTRER
ncbi:MAG: HEAT repeat domain-containing protein [Granulosicoccus sp.]|nr:HEAT repeat domain-containing protein [Granulosicoccus sp.]